jgi:MFS family permease
LFRDWFVGQPHKRFLLYPSVFLGPFGGNTVLALIPSLERFFTDKPGFIPVSIMFYMIPFAFFQLFSGALSDIYGRKRIILFVVECVPESRGAASSIYNSFRFLGYGLAPVASLPVYLVYGLQGIVLLCVGFVVLNMVISMRVKG